MPNKSAVRHFLSEEKRTYTDRMAAHRKSDRRCDDLLRGRTS